MVYLNFVYGSLQITNVFLSVVAGAIALTLFMAAWRKSSLKAWRPLIFALIFFAVEEILGALRSFNIYSTPHLTHVVPSIILGLLITALVLQIDVKSRGLK